MTRPALSRLRPARLLPAWRRRRRGASALSYALLVGLIGVVALFAIDLLGTQLGTLMSRAGDALSRSGDALAQTADGSCGPGEVLTGIDEGNPVCASISSVLAADGGEQDPTVASEVKDGVAADETSFDNSSAALSGSPANVQAALDSLAGSSTGASCTVREDQTPGVVQSNVGCLSGQTLVGGGCDLANLSGGRLVESRFDQSTSTWVCFTDSANSVTAQAICCDF